MDVSTTSMEAPPHGQAAVSRITSEAGPSMTLRIPQVSRNCSRGCPLKRVRNFPSAVPRTAMCGWMACRFPIIMRASCARTATSRLKTPDQPTEFTLTASASVAVVMCSCLMSFRLARSFCRPTQRRVWRFMTRVQRRASTASTSRRS